MSIPSVSRVTDFTYHCTSDIKTALIFLTIFHQVKDFERLPLSFWTNGYALVCSARAFQERKRWSQNITHSANHWTTELSHGVYPKQIFINASKIKPIDSSVSRHDRSFSATSLFRRELIKTSRTVDHRINSSA